jgi:DNA transformation protein
MLIYDMRNIGSVSQRWLAEIEIFTRDDLRRVGAIAAWVHIRQRPPKAATKNLLWALVGAERDLDWRQLPSALKQEILSQLGNGHNSDAEPF